MVFPTFFSSLNLVHCALMLGLRIASTYETSPKKDEILFEGGINSPAFSQNIFETSILQLYENGRNTERKSLE